MGRSCRSLGALIGAAVALLVVCASASAAFPGRNGLLAVQPLGGAGVILASDHGAHAHRICTAGCPNAEAPRWSPDGRSLVLLSGSVPGAAVASVRVLAADGSCIDCLFGEASAPAFRPDGRTVAFLTAGHLVAWDGLDDLPQGAQYEPLPRLPATDQVWSAQGRLAIVARAHLFIADADGYDQPLGAGTSPDWSPDGLTLAIARRGWIWVISARTGRGRRLVRGGEPAYAPDGRWIAFIGTHHRVETIPVAGGHAVAVGGLSGRSVDWQPAPVGPRPPCEPPVGAKLLAGDGQGSVFIRTDARDDVTAMSCGDAGEPLRVLEKLPYRGTQDTGFPEVTLAAVNGSAAALVNYDPSNTEVDTAVFDVRSGQPIPRATLSHAALIGGDPGFTAVAVGSNGDPAVIETDPDNQHAAHEQILASTPTGIVQLASLDVDQAQGQSGLTNLTATEDTLSWEQNGTPETAQLN